MNKELRIKKMLHVNTSSREQVEISVEVGDQVYKDVSEVGLMRSQPTLPLIDTVLNKAKISLADLTGISVFPGPGSFTGIRVGVAITNALSFALQKKIADQPLGFIEDAKY